MTERLTLEQEKELVDQAKADLARFKALYEYYLPKIYRYLYFRTSSKPDAEDLASQVFVQAIRNFDRYEWTGVSFGAWLYRIAHNLLVDHYKSSRTVPLEHAEEVPEASEVDEQLDAKLDAEKLHSCLGALNEPARSMLSLRIFQELSYQEIAQVLDTTEAAVKMQMHRAVKKIQSLVNTYGK